MGFKDNIENLFASETPETEESLAKELPQIPSGIEKREFTRIDITERKVGLRFSNQLQFARQYIENISLGGLFVKTTEKYKLGDLVGIEFKVPDPQRPGEEIEFTLKASVCRVAAHGVGLEFTNLTSEYRNMLEAYVRSTLPRGLDVHAKPKQSSLDRVESLRETKRQSQAAKKKLQIRIAGIAGLILLNAFLAKEAIRKDPLESMTKDQSIQIGNQQVDLRQIESVVKKPDGSIWMQSKDGSINLPLKQNENILPAHLRHQINIAQSVAPKKPARRSKNTRNLTNTR